MDEWHIKETLVELVVWIFLPIVLPNMLQSCWYSVRYRSKPAATPPKDSPTFKRHTSRILCGVVLAYLVYVVYEADRSLGLTHYDTLELGFHEFSQKTLKTNFRKASLRYHPDKVGREGADIFVRIRGAHEVLSDPVKRYAYDHFGPSALKCTTCITAKDYLQNGLTTMSSFFMLAFVVLLLMSLLGKAPHGRYWRFIFLVAMGALELAMVLSPTPIALVEWILPGRVTFEQITLMHRFYLSAAIAASWIGPILIPSHDALVRGSLQERLKKLQDLTNDAINVFQDSEDCMAHFRRKLGAASLEWKLREDQKYKEHRLSSGLRPSHEK
ncbi:hypothetical protein BGZ99_010276 [Dissophora globulifera]|uniref:J domain-containing protein n=1 Tax=Dissophora globulifera TaxID=979702 RepID=A0A9P6UL63_9FUNG|nr:hypothetical protein BGZ99_010276 [Dissophora globulifera]